MLDFDKLCFEEVDTEHLPVLVLFGYSTESADIENFLLHELSKDDVPENDKVKSIEFELFIFSMDDFKVQCTLYGAESDYLIGDYIEVMHNAFEWLNQIPSEDLQRIKDFVKSQKSIRG